MFRDASVIDGYLRDHAHIPCFVEFIDRHGLAQCLVVNAAQPNGRLIAGPGQFERRVSGFQAGFRRLYVVAGGDGGRKSAFKVHHGHLRFIELAGDFDIRKYRTCEDVIKRVLRYGKAVYGFDKIRLGVCFLHFNAQKVEFRCGACVKTVFNGLHVGCDQFDRFLRHFYEFLREKKVIKSFLHHVNQVHAGGIDGENGRFLVFFSHELAVFDAVGSV